MNGDELNNYESGYSITQYLELKIEVKTVVVEKVKASDPIYRNPLWGFLQIVTLSSVLMW